MKRSVFSFSRATLGTMLGAAIVFAAPSTALAAQELTPVQVAFLNHRPLSFDVAQKVPAAAQSSESATPQSPTAPQVRPPSPMAGEFRPASRAKVFFYAFELMFYEQVLRVATQAESRSELKGPFFKDWFDSVHVPKKWGDQDPWQTNYIGHAIHGSAAARIWLDQREPKATTKKQYLTSMARALVFAAIFSELFENGPISEASIGNVARHHDRTGWVDHVWTPVGGVLWTMAEDAIDKYVLTEVDRRVPFVLARVAARMILNPGRMLANVSQNRAPWYRSDRSLTFRMTGGR